MTHPQRRQPKQKGEVEKKQEHGERIKVNMTDAAQAIFSVFEMLESILLEVDPDTLVRSAPRVCKTWNHTIAGSGPIQQRLYLTPCAEETDTSSDPPAPVGQATRVRNPVLARVFLPFFHTTLTDLVAADAALQCIVGTALNNSHVESPILRRGATWRNMFISQPPTYKIGYVESNGPSNRHSFHRAVVDVPGGVTMGKLYDVAYTLVLGRRGTRGRFGVYWREKANDPPAQWYGCEGNPLSMFPEDVRIVIRWDVTGEEYPEVPGNKDDLSSRYMPEEFEFCLPEIEYTCGQPDPYDWFG